MRNLSRAIAIGFGASLAVVAYLGGTLLLAVWIGFTLESHLEWRSGSADPIIWAIWLVFVLGATYTYIALLRDRAQNNP